MFSANIIRTLNWTHYLANVAFDVLISSVAKDHLPLSPLFIHSVPHLRPAVLPRSFHVGLPLCSSIIVT